MKKEKMPPLEEGLQQAMQAIDKQIARQMQRNPAELETQGVQKWEPYDERIELVASHVLNLLGEQVVDLDSVFVLAQSFVKVLALATEDLGAEGLGKIRSAYMAAAMEKIARDSSQTLGLLRENTDLT